MIIKPTPCHLLINNGPERSLTERYTSTIQKLVDMLTFSGNTSWVCAYQFKQDSETYKVVSNGVSGFSVWVEDLRPKTLHIARDGKPLTREFYSDDDLIAFDFSLMAIVDEFAEDPKLESLPTVEDLATYIEQSIQVVEAKTQSRSKLEGLVRDFLTGMCCIKGTKAKAMAKNYSGSITEDELKKFPATEHGIIFRIASDWNRRKEVFGD